MSSNAAGVLSVIALVFVSWWMPACSHSSSSEPITDLQAGKWTWVDFPDAKCRDGSSTGIAINTGPDPAKLMIMLWGGGACFNAATCAGNPSSFSAADFTALDVVCGSDAGPRCTGVNSGILDRTNPANPVKDWNYVFVPYCTGDVHGGDNPIGTVASLSGTQQFVGYVNMGLYLARLAPTFPSAKHVLLTGVSAGGYGSVVTYGPVSRAFASARVDLIDDSGPVLSDPYFAACLQGLERQTWNLDDTAFQDCQGECPNAGTQFFDLYQHHIKTHPGATFGVVSSNDDDSATAMFGWGFNNCTGHQTLTAAQFTAGLQDLESKLVSYPNAGAFVFPGTAHTSLVTGAFFTRIAGIGTDSVGGVLLSDWVRNMLSGTAANVGP